MPRSKKADKFFIYAPVRKGRRKGQRLLGTNTEEGVTVQDLLDFLKKHDVEPSSVPLRAFVTYTK